MNSEYVIDVCFRLMQAFEPDLMKHNRLMQEIVPSLLSTSPLPVESVSFISGLTSGMYLALALQNSGVKVEEILGIKTWREELGELGL